MSDKKLTYRVPPLVPPLVPLPDDPVPYPPPVDPVPYPLPVEPVPEEEPDMPDPLRLPHVVPLEELPLRSLFQLPRSVRLVSMSFS